MATKSKKAEKATETPVVTEVVEPKPTDVITMNYSDDEGKQLVNETNRSILSSGAWVSAMFRYQNLDKKSGEFGEEKITLRRYQKKDGAYKAKSKFNISSIKQAEQIIAQLTEWTTELKKAEKAS